MKQRCIILPSQRTIHHYTKNMQINCKVQVPNSVDNSLFLIYNENTIWPMIYIARLTYLLRKGKNVYVSAKFNCTTYQSRQERQATTLVPSSSDRTNSFTGVLESFLPKVQWKVPLIMINWTRISLIALPWGWIGNLIDCFCCCRLHMWSQCLEMKGNMSGKSYNFVFF